MQLLNALPWHAITPELFLAISAMVLLMCSVFTRENTAKRQASFLPSLTVVVMLGAMWFVLRGYGVGWQQVSETGPSKMMLFDGMFLVSPFTQVMKSLILLGAALVMWMVMGLSRRQESMAPEFPALLTLATTGLLLMVSANDLLALYMGLELASLALYVMAAMDRDNPRSTEAGIKYFVLGALASGMLLYGCSLVYGFSGATRFDAIAAFLSQGEAATHTGVIVGLVFMLVGMCFKISAVPFHMWTPDVYEGSPTVVTAYFAIAPKMAALAMLLRVLLEPFASLAWQWQQVVAVIAVGSMLIGAFAALRQHHIKRLLAYSSIGHVGYALVGLLVGTVSGVQSVVIYLAIYMVMSAGTFGIVLAMRRKGKIVEEILDLRGLSRTHPYLAAAMAIFMFSMAGIPPLAGFFGKLMVFRAAIEAGWLWLAIIGVLTSVVSAYYYLRIVKVMYLDEAQAPLDPLENIEMRLLITVSALATLLFIAVPAPLFAWAKAAAMGMGLK